jgi:thioredoxin
MREVGDDSFEREVLQAERPVVVDFWAPWCKWCDPVTRLLEGFSGEQGVKADFVKVNADVSYVTASRYEVLSLPTAILFEGGEERARVVGARPRSHFERAFANWL